MSQRKKSFTFSYAGFSQKGIHCFRILSLKDNSVFYGGEYFTESKEDISLKDVVLAINICTFKREKYLYRNVRSLLDKLYSQYVELAKEFPDILFGGRLGQYKYFNMDQVIWVALDMVATM